MSVEELGRQCALRPAADESIMVDGDDAVGVARRLRALAHTIEGQRSVPVNQFYLHFVLILGFNLLLRWCPHAAAVEDIPSTTLGPALAQCVATFRTAGGWGPLATELQDVEGHVQRLLERASE